jgi:hypothetical protein
VVIPVSAQLVGKKFDLIDTHLSNAPGQWSREIRALKPVAEIQASLFKLMHGGALASSQQAGACVILKQLSIANIAAQGINRAMAGNVHHFEDIRAFFGGRCEEASPEGMPGE